MLTNDQGFLLAWAEAGPFAAVAELNAAEFTHWFALRERERLRWLRENEGFGPPVDLLAEERRNEGEIREAIARLGRARARCGPPS